MQGKLEPQAYIDALRKGDYVFASIGLAKKIYDKYQSLSEKPLSADDVTPLLTNLFAETDLSIKDLPLIQLGILSIGASYGPGEATYYMTQIMAAAAALFSHEVWLREQEGNQDKSPQGIRHIVQDEITQAFKENGLKAAEGITEGKMSKEVDPAVLIVKETTYKKVFAYAVNHLISKNNALVRETGKLLIARLDEVEAQIVELDKKADASEGDSKEIGTLGRKARKSQREIEDHLSFLMVQPKDFNANNALSWMLDQGYLQEVKQQIESYLDFFNKNPIDDPKNNQGLLKAYDARKYAAAMMLTAIKTASLRPPQATLAILQDSAKMIENNRPGPWELGIIAWIIDLFIKKSEMTKITDKTLQLTKAEIKTLRTKNWFFQSRKALNEVNAEDSGPEAADKDIPYCIFD
ncbi:hypothetical protein [Legionella sp. WA2022007384]